MTGEELAAFVEASRARQGLPARIADPAGIARLAALIAGQHDPAGRARLSNKERSAAQQIDADSCRPARRRRAAS